MILDAFAQAFPMLVMMGIGAFFAFIHRRFFMHRMEYGFISAMKAEFKKRENVRHIRNFWCATKPDGTLAILLYDGSRKGKMLKIPAQLNGCRVTSIGMLAFARCGQEQIILEEGIEKIDEKAFAQCMDTSVIQLPDSVKIIGESAFGDCRGIAALNLSHVEQMGNYAFSNCRNLQQISLPDSVKSIGLNPFHSCKRLKKIGISEKHPIFAVVDECVLCDKAEKRVIGSPPSDSLVSCSIPEGMRTIGANAFIYARKLAKVTLPESLERMEESAFAFCDELNDVQFPQGLVSIGKEALRNCKALTSVNLPAGLKSMGEMAFFGCEKLEQFAIPQDTVCENLDMGYCRKLRRMEILSRNTNTKINAFVCCDALETVVLPPDHPTLQAKDQMLLSRDGKRLFSYFGSGKTSCTIPQGVCVIGKEAFKKTPDLREIILPDSVTTLEERAFYEIRQTANIHVPASVVRIADNAFCLCENCTLIVEQGSQAHWMARKKEWKKKVI